MQKWKGECRQLCCPCMGWNHSQIPNWPLGWCSFFKFPARTSASPSWSWWPPQEPVLGGPGLFGWQWRVQGSPSSVPFVLVSQHCFTLGRPRALLYLHFPRSLPSWHHACYISGDQRDLRHNCTINEMQLMPSRHWNPWRASCRAALLQVYASKFLISIGDCRLCWGGCWLGSSFSCPAQGLCTSHFISAPRVPLWLTSLQVLWDWDDLPKDSQHKEDKVRAAGWASFAQPRPSPCL